MLKCVKMFGKTKIWIDEHFEKWDRVQMSFLDFEDARDFSIYKWNFVLG